MRVTCGIDTGEGRPEQAVKLLGAQEPFLQRSGAKRVRRLADSDKSLRALLREQAPARLLALLHADADAGRHNGRHLIGAVAKLHMCACCESPCSWAARDHVW